jgi:hypothetical protein
MLQFAKIGWFTSVRSTFAYFWTRKWMANMPISHDWILLSEGDRKSSLNTGFDW